MWPALALSLRDEPAGDAVTAPVTVTHCARCGASATAHELARDGRTRTVRLGQTAGATSSVACPGFEPGPVVDLVGEGELRRRLDAVAAEAELLARRLAAVLALHTEMAVFRSDFPHPGRLVDRCLCGWRGEPRRRGTLAERCPTVRAARGET